MTKIRDVVKKLAVAACKAIDAGNFEVINDIDSTGYTIYLEDEVRVVIPLSSCLPSEVLVGDDGVLQMPVHEDNHLTGILRKHIRNSMKQKEEKAQQIVVSRLEAYLEKYISEGEQE